MTKLALTLALCASMLAIRPCAAQDRRDDGDHRYGVDRHDDRYDADHDDCDDDFDCRNVYLGLGPLWTHQDFHESAHVLTGGTGANVDADSSAFGAEGRVGFRAARHIAVEAQAQYYGSVRFDAQRAGTSSDVGHFEGISVMGNFKIFPIAGRVQPYLLGGVGLLWAKLRNDLPGALNGDRTELAGHAGVGVDFYLDEHFSANIEGSYLIPASNLKDFPLTAVSTGLQYHF